jgi:hypothetical protein
VATYGRFWTLNVIVGVLAIVAGLGLVAWLLLHPIKHWPEFDGMKDAGGQWKVPERVPEPVWVGT